MKGAAGLILLMLTIGGCAPIFGPEPLSAPIDKCAGWTRGEYTPGDIEVISDELAEWLDSHEANGEKNGCWES